MLCSNKSHIFALSTSESSEEVTTWVEYLKRVQYRTTTLLTNRPILYVIYFITLLSNGPMWSTMNYTALLTHGPLWYVMYLITHLVDGPIQHDMHCIALLADGPMQRIMYWIAHLTDGPRKSALNYIMLLVDGTIPSSVYNRFTHSPHSLSHPWHAVLSYGAITQCIFQSHSLKGSCMQQLA